MKDILDDLMNGMSECMQKATEEYPEESKNWTREELFENGAMWAGRHVLLTEDKENE